MEKRVLVLFPMTAEQQETLQAAAPGCTFRYAASKSATREDVLWAQVILGNPPLPFLKETTGLELLSLARAGSADCCEPGVLPEGVTLTNATGAYGIIISEWMIGMVLSIYNHFAVYRAQQLQHLWKKQSLGRHSLYGAKVLVVGAGNIGTEFAIRAKAMGAYTVGVRRTVGEVHPAYDEMHLIGDLDALLPEADIVALSVPGTDATNHLMNDARLALMKEGSLLLNVGRGNAVDTDALYTHLKNGHLLAAGLDVTDPEPLPAEHPLWGLENAFITPHVSGGIDSPISCGVIFELLLHNLKAHLTGGEYRNVVDRETGYKKH